MRNKDTWYGGTKTPGMDVIFPTLPNQVFENVNKLSYCPKTKLTDVFYSY